MIIETKKRTIAKAFTWRIWATAILFLLTGLITGSWGVAGAIIGIDIIIKTSLYYIHERLWANSNFGRIYVEN